MTFIAVNEPSLNGNEKKYLNECIDSGWISSEGPFVKKLEEDFSKYCAQKYGIAVANGSVALDVAIRALKDVYNFEENSLSYYYSGNIHSSKIFLNDVKKNQKIDPKGL